VSFNHKQTSVGVQTSDSNVAVVEQWQPRSAQDRELVSTGTQTDDVIVVSVFRQLHSSSDVNDGLFTSSHGSLLSCIRESDVHSVSCDRDTDSGHMSDAEKLLSTAVESIDRSGEELSRCTVKRLFAIRGSTVSEEVNGATVIAQATESATSYGCQHSEAAVIQDKNLPAVSQKLSSAEPCQLLRWTTATRLNVLEENDTLRIGRQPETFFASLEQLDNQHAVSNDVDISLLSCYKESKLPLLSCRMPPINSQTEFSVDHVNQDIIMSNSSQSSADTGSQHCDNLPSLNSSDASVSCPLSGTHSRVSKGLTYSHSSQPRLSVGRKSLSKRRSVALRDKCHPPTKISRPAAWLMSATKATRSKVQ